MPRIRAKVAAVLIALPAAFAAFAAVPAAPARAADCVDAVTLANYYISVGDYATAFKLVGYTLLDATDTGCT